MHNLISVSVKCKFSCSHLLSKKKIGEGGGGEEEEEIGREEGVQKSTKEEQLTFLHIFNVLCFVHCSSPAVLVFLRVHSVLLLLVSVGTLSEREMGGEKPCSILSLISHICFSISSK